MIDLSDLYQYYVDSMNFLRHKGKEFAQKYPDVATALRFGEDGSQDPDVQRLMESFALIDARLHYNLAKEKDLMAEFLLNHIYPEILAPLPSATILKIDGSVSRNIAKNTRCRVKNKNGNEYTFVTMSDVSVGQYKIVSITRAMLDNLGPCIVVEVSVAESIQAIELYADWEMVKELSRKAIYRHDDMTQVGQARIREFENHENPYLPLHQYKILAKSFDFIALRFAAPLRPGVVKLALQCSLEPQKHTMLPGCVAAVNLFKKRSEPVKYTSTRDCLEIIPDVTQLRYKVHAISDLYFYDPTRRKDTLIPKMEYFYRAEDGYNYIKIYLTQKFRANLAEHMIIFADLMCSDVGLCEPDQIKIDGYEYLGVSHVISPTEFRHNASQDKWRDLFKISLKPASNSDFYKNFSHDILSLHNLDNVDSLDVTHSEEARILDPKRAFASVVATDVFTIKGRSSLARVLGKVMVDANRSQKMCQSVIVDSNDKIIDIIGDCVE